ncbi:conserved hypothetical protein [Echinococcus multilocularis]|uniref:Neuropeptide n=1 Tax=Echinococcus multilocularis TaxID=6211 RepID=A0A068YEY9_ECHMU|nr:conserved hypothetical protein [Echinococcus multilocularis]
MFPCKFIFCLSLVCFCLILLEAPQTSGVRLQRQLLGGLANVDPLEDSRNQLLFEELDSLSPEIHSRLSAKRGFVRLG